MKFRPSFAVAVLIAALALARVNGSDIAINVAGLQDQEKPSMAQLANGALVFVYEDESVPNGQILLRRFHADLSANGGEMRVNAATNGERRDPVIAPLTGGGFVVAYSAGNLDGDNYAVAYRRFDANASPLDANDVQANTITTAAQFHPQIAPLASGGFVLCWVGQSGGLGQDVYYRRFAANGAALDATEVLANGLGNAPVTAGDQGRAKIAALSDGGFVIVYEDRATDDVFGVRIAATGGAVDVPGEPAGTKQFRVNVATEFEQTGPAVADLADGGFVVVFNSETNGTAASRVVMGRRFDVAGLGGPEFLVGGHTNRWQDAAVAGLPNGDFAVVWQAQVWQGSPAVLAWDVFEQSYNAFGDSKFAFSKVPAFDQGNQNSPMVAKLGHDGYAIAWNSFGQDADGYGVFARGYSLAPGNLAMMALAGNPALVLTFSGPTGRSHQLQGTLDWNSWIPVLNTNADVFSVSVPVTNRFQFFRVQSQ